MPAADRKFKQTVPSGKVPAFLRSLADAFEGRTKNLAPLVGDLSLPLTKLEIKAKAGAGFWEFKVKIRTAAADAPKPVGAAESIPAAGSPAADYRQVKKQLKIAFDAIRRSIAARRFPEE